MGFLSIPTFSYGSPLPPPMDYSQTVTNSSKHNAKDVREENAVQILGARLCTEKRFCKARFPLLSHLEKRNCSESEDFLKKML